MVKKAKKNKIIGTKELMKGIDQEFYAEGRTPPCATTVGELISVLERLPKEMKMHTSKPGTKCAIYVYGQNRKQLCCEISEW